MSEGEATEPESGRERLLDAAESCLERFGLAKTTIEDVAQAAGLSRATVYRQFGNRDALLLGVAAREADRLAEQAGAFLERFDDVESWLVEGILFCLREVPRRPLLAQFLAPQEVGAASRLVLTSERMIAIGTEILRPMFEPAQSAGLLHRDVELNSLIEWILRILMSFLAVPGPAERSEDELRRILQTLLVPAVVVVGGRTSG
jgi:AcrR family transcriptional regulator